MLPRQASSESPLRAQHRRPLGWLRGWVVEPRTESLATVPVVKEQAAKYGESALSDDAKAISQRLEFVDSREAEYALESELCQL